VSVARPLSVRVYAPLSRLCAMNPRIAMDCIARADMPIAAWSMRVAAQNKMTRSCAVSFVVSFSMAYSRRQLLGNAAIAASRAAVSCSKPTLYSITSSARASSVGGTSMPSASAVFE
jgi:hypothetical protein